VARVDYSDEDQPSRDELVSLYASVGWAAYTQEPSDLERALENSTYVVTARHQGELVGLARVLSDDVSILYLQDVLVHPDHQRGGVAAALLRQCLGRFDHVRQRVLLTDDEAHQHRLYRSLGYTDIADVTKVPLHAFVAIRGVDLT